MYISFVPCLLVALLPLVLAHLCYDSMYMFSSVLALDVTVLIVHLASSVTDIYLYTCLSLYVYVFYVPHHPSPTLVCVSSPMHATEVSAMLYGVIPTHRKLVVSGTIRAYDLASSSASATLSSLRRPSCHVSTVVKDYFYSTWVI
jgi:hypothetical protein